MDLSQLTEWLSLIDNGVSTLGWPHMLLLTLLAFFGGILNAISGGAGLIVLPVLLWSGIPPINALATNKFQALFGTISSSINFIRKGLVDLKALKLMLVIGPITAILGTLAIQYLSNDLLKIVIPYFLIFLALYTWFTPAIDSHDRPAKLSQNKFSLLMGGSIGFYGGFFGPGMGALTSLSFANLRGFNLRKATANTKPFVFSCNLVSALVFLLGGQVWILLAVMMACAQIVGGRIGSNLVISKGSALVKPILIITTLAIAIKLLVDAHI